MIDDLDTTKVAQEMGYNAGQELRKMMLDAGLTSGQIEKVVKEALDGISINGVPIRAVSCEHCQGRGWKSPEELP